MIDFAEGSSNAWKLLKNLYPKKYSRRNDSAPVLMFRLILMTTLINRVCIGVAAEQERVISLVPESWICNAIHYGTRDGCHCECGAYDPDCDIADNSINIVNCKAGDSCVGSAFGKCRNSHRQLLTRRNAQERRRGRPCCGGGGGGGGGGGSGSGKKKVSGGRSRTKRTSRSGGGGGGVGSVGGGGESGSGQTGTGKKKKKKKNYTRKSTVEYDTEKDGNFEAYILRLINLEKEKKKDYIKVINCNGRNLNGSIPFEIANLSKLEELHLDSNQFNGTVPSELGSLQNLKILQLSNNELSGSLSSELGALTKLQNMEFNNNTLVSSIPTTFGGLESLKVLRMGENKLTGRIPSEIGDMRELVMLMLEANQLTGHIPRHISNLTTLKVLYLDKNELSGPIPKQLGKMENLLEFYFFGNQISGPLPTEIGNLKNLVQLNAIDNRITGKIPKQLGRLKQLEDLSLDGNLFNGTLPKELESLDELIFLHMSNNKMTGTFPVEWTKLNSLEELFLDNNQLTGPLPSQLFKLKRIRRLNLENNRFSGQIPLSGAKFNNEVDLSFGNNRLEIDNEIADFIEKRRKEKKIINLQIRDNFEANCDEKLLSWYPEFSDSVVDREQIRCAGTNIYGELGLNPHVLRIDENAPDGNTKWENVDESKTTSASVLVEWSYDILKNPDLKTYSFESDDAEDVFDELEGQPKGHPIGNFLDRFNTFEYEFTRGKIDGTEQLRLFRNCMPFEKPVSESSTAKHSFIGFEVSWKLANVENEKVERICLLAMENETQNFFHSTTTPPYAYNITNMILPAKSYRINIRPFYLNLIPDENLAQLVFGIQSRTLVRRTEDGRPEYPPLNPRLSRLTDNAATLEWDPLTESQSNGKIIAYIVERFDEKVMNCSQQQPGENVFDDTNGTFYIFRSLLPGTQYWFRVRAKTSGGEGPWSNCKRVETCPRNSISESSDGNCLAESGYFNDNNVGFTACSDFSNEMDIQKNCFGDERVKTASELRLKNGFWRPNIDTALNIKLCPKPKFCQTAGNTTRDKALSFYSMDSDRHCAEHHTGVYCSDCVKNYSLSSTGCKSCGGKIEDHKSKFIWYASILIILVILYLLKMIVSSGLLPVFNHSNKRGGSVMVMISKLSSVYIRHLSTKVKIWIVTSQILVSLQNTYSSKVGVYVPGEGLYLFISLQLQELFIKLEVQCYSEVTFYKKLLFVTLGPIIVLLFFWLVRVVIRLTIKNNGEKDSGTAIHHEFLTLFLLVTFFIYAPVSQVIIETFLCETINFKNSTVAYLRADYRFSCESKQHTKYQVYSAFMVVLYPIGILLMYGYLLHRRKLVSHKKQALVSDETATESFKSNLSFLTRPYRQECYWFEIYELLRKLFMTSLVVVVASQEDDKNGFAAETFGLVTAIMSLVFLMFIRPYQYDDDYLFSVLSVVILCLSTQVSALGEFRRNPGSNSQDQSQYEANIFAVLLWLEFCIFLGFVLVGIWINCRKTSPQGGHKDQRSDFMETEIIDETLRTQNSDIWNEKALLDQIDMSCYLHETEKMVEKLKLELKNTKRELENAKVVISSIKK